MQAVMAEPWERSGPDSWIAKVLPPGDVLARAVSVRRRSRGCWEAATVGVLPITSGGHKTMAEARAAAVGLVSR